MGGDFMEEENGQTINEQIYAELGEPGSDSQDSSTESAEAKPTEEVTETETAEAAETVENQDEGEGEAKNSSKNRIHELAGEKNLAQAETRVKDAQLRSLQEQLAGDDGDDAAMPQLPQLQPGEEISPEQYQQHVVQTANALVDLKLKQRDNAVRIKGELGDAMTEYAELNPKAKDGFDPELSNAITGAVGAYIKANPTGNVKKYIDGLMKPYQKAIARGVTKQQETVAKQVSETALRPTQHKPVEKKFQSLSIDEMEAKLGKVY